MFNLLVEVISESSSAITSGITSAISSSGDTASLPFTDWNSFLTWFVDVVLPWIVAFVTSGGLATLIYKLAKFVSNTTINKSILLDTRLSISNLKKDIQKLEQRDKEKTALIEKLISQIPNDDLKEEITAELNAIDTSSLYADLEEKPVITVKIKKSKKNKIVAFFKR